MVSSHVGLTVQRGRMDMAPATWIVQATKGIAGQVDEIQVAAKAVIGAIAGSLDGISAAIAAAVRQKGEGSGAQEVSEGIRAATGAAGEAGRKAGREAGQNLKVSGTLAQPACGWTRRPGISSSMSVLREC